MTDHKQEAERAAPEQDPLYEKAVQVVRAHNRASLSLVQRTLVLGYNRTARLFEAMEKAGVMSALDANGHRTVLPVERVADAGADGLPALPVPHWTKTQSYTAEQVRQVQREAVEADRRTRGMTPEVSRKYFEQWYAWYGDPNGFVDEAWTALKTPGVTSPHRLQGSDNE